MPQRPRQPLTSLTKRDVAILSAWDSHQNYDAMVTALGIPLGTIKSRLHRARVRKARLFPEMKTESA